MSIGPMLSWIFIFSLFQKYLKLTFVITHLISLVIYPSLCVLWMLRLALCNLEKYALHHDKHVIAGCVAAPSTAKAEDQIESEVAMGYTMTEICDKFIEFFMHKKPETKDWRKVLVFREEWQRYRKHFYKRCQVRIDMETDSSLKQKLVVLARKVKKVSHYLVSLCTFVQCVLTILNIIFVTALKNRNLCHCQFLEFQLFRLDSVTVDF